MLKRRDLIIGASSVAIAPLLSWDARASSLERPPVARTVDTIDERFGLNLPDPYRWMENADDPDWEPFMRGQEAYARRQLDALPHRRSIARRIADLSGDLPVAYKVQRVAGKIFVELRPEGALSYKLYVHDRAGANRRLLYDPEQETDRNGAHRSLDYWAVSPDGEYVAFGSSPAGSEDSVLRVLVTRDGSLLQEQLDRAQYARLAWLPDSRSFFFSRLKEGAGRNGTDYYDDSAVWLHELGDDPKDDLRIAGGGDVLDGYEIASKEFPAAITDQGSDWVLLQASGAVRRHNPVLAARLDDVRAGCARWRSVLTLDDEVTNIVLRGDHLFYVSERSAPNGRVLKKKLASPDDDAQLVAEETEFPIEPTAHGTLMAAARDGIYFVRTKGGSQSVYRIGNDGGVTALSTPFEAGVHNLFTSTREDGLYAAMSGWVQPFGLWRYEPGQEGFVDTGLSPLPAFNLHPFTSFQIVATARDGTRVPVSVIARRDLRRDGSAPCLARCYGAYGASARPSFNPRVLALLDRGGVFAQVHARGGGEFGLRWWKAGQKETKPNTWRDFIDGCQALIAEGITAQGRLTITGGSAGGIAVGRALTERPDMFAGAIFNVAFTNPTRIEADAAGPAQYDEFGDPNVESEFKALYEMDTYQHVRDGERYPAALIMHGMTDSRVPPWHSAKLAARMQRAAAGENPVLLRVTFDAGHGAGSTRTQVDEKWADIIAFTLWRATMSQ